MDVTRNLIITDNDGLDHHWHRASYFVIRNANKREMVVDLSEAGGARDHARSSSPTRGRRRRELHAARDGELRAGLRDADARSSPTSSCARSPATGRRARCATTARYGMGLEPASGISSITGYQDGPPMRSGLSFTDPYSGFVGAGAILTALHYRRRTGKGQYIDLSEQEAAIPIMGAALLEYQMTGRIPERIGDRSDWAAPQGCYRCAGDDRWAVISCRERRGVRAHGGGDGAPGVEGRRALRDGARAAREPRRARRGDHGVDVAARPLRRDAHAAEGGREGGGRARRQGGRCSTRTSRRADSSTSSTSRCWASGRCRGTSRRSSRASRRRHAGTSPLLGEHNDEVLKEIGYSDERDRASCRKTGAIGDEPNAAGAAAARLGGAEAAVRPLHRARHPAGDRAGLPRAAGHRGRT